MRRLALLLLTLAALIPSAAFAQVEMQITPARAGDMLGSLNALTGQRDVLVGKGDSQQIAKLPYNLSGDTRWILHDNITALRKVYDSAQEIVKQLVVQAEAKNGGPLRPIKEAVIEGGKLLAEPILSPEQIALNAEITKLVETPRPVKLYKIKRADWKLNENAFPGQILASLDLITEP